MVNPVRGPGQRPLKRRDFLGHGARLAGAGLWGLPLLSGCGGGGDGDPVVGEPAAPLYTRTLFFNLAHLDHTRRQYRLVTARGIHALVPVASAPGVLLRERASNAFLAALPDAVVTHHAEGVTLAAGIVMLSHLMELTPGDTSGRWSMAGVYLHVPPAGVAVAHARARARAGASAALPLSAQRARYGLVPARSLQDLQDETVLADSTLHAATLTMLTPGLLAYEPGAAGHVMINHLGPQARALGAVQARIDALGSAVPADAGTPGWATLLPVNGQDGSPLRIAKGGNAGLFVYHPQWHPDVKRAVAAVAKSTRPGVGDDETLGLNATRLAPTQTGAGTLWTRLEGAPTRHAAATATQAAEDVQMVLDETNAEAGLDIDVETDGTDEQLQVSVTLSNSYLRFLGAHLQFLDANHQPIALKDIALWQQKRLFVSPDQRPYPDDATTYAFAGIVPAITTVMGLRVDARIFYGSFEFAFRMPSEARSVRLLAGGLGAQGSNTDPDTIAAGVGLTLFINYGVTLFAAIAGALDVLASMNSLVAELAEELAEEIEALYVGITDVEYTRPAFWADQAMFIINLVHAVAEAVPGEQSAVAKFLEKAVIEVIGEQVFDALPVVGQILEGFSAFFGFIDLGQTTYEVLNSPWTYVKQLSFTHTLTVTLQPDDRDATFPKAATDYRVTATVPGCTPMLYEGTLSGPTRGPLTVEFRELPRGGTVDVSVAFVQRGLPGAADILLGKGAVQGAPNGDAPIELRITEYAFPIDASTRYLHSQKTMLTDDGGHVWRPVATPPETSSLACGSTGTICALRSLTVSQGNASRPGYLGYSWQSHNAEAQVPSCNGAGEAQFDQYANLNTDPDDAQSGYVLSSCGIAEAGVTLAYNLLGADAGNFYLDTSDPQARMIRRVNLQGQPSFDPSGGGSSWGLLNLPSDRLLVHPSGRALSFNRANHVLETHRLPLTALADADAQRQLKAQVRSGKGSRAGLLTEPVSAAVGADGVVIVLEQGNNRLQAFDLTGNAVPYFKQQPQAEFLRLTTTDPDAGWEHLDVALEFTGLIYVLSRLGSQHRLSLYSPQQAGSTPLAVTPGVSAMRIAVDYWRNLYSLNYEVIQRANGTNAQPAPVTEPSISLWVPCSAGRSC